MSDSRRCPKTKVSYIAATVLGTWHILPLICGPVLQGRYCCTHFVDEETEVQREEWLLQAHSGKKKKIQNSFGIQTLSQIHTVYSVRFSLLQTKRTIHWGKLSQRCQRIFADLPQRDLCLRKTSLSYMSGPEGLYLLLGELENLDKWKKVLFACLLVCLFKYKTPDYVKWQLPEILSLSLSKCQ